MFKYSLGDVVKDVFTGFSGTIMAATMYITGCNHYGILPLKLTKEGKIRDYEWLDESRLVLIKSKPVKYRAPNTSGPEQNPPNY